MRLKRCLMSSWKCDCGSTQINFIITPEFVHYGKEECLSCGKFIRWIQNPEKAKYRSSTTKCKIKYDFCKICLRTKKELGCNETLEAHHIIELTEGGDDIPENIMVVCTACHKFINWIRLYFNRHFKKEVDNEYTK